MKIAIVSMALLGLVSPIASQAQSTCSDPANGLCIIDVAQSGAKWVLSPDELVLAAADGKDYDLYWKLTAPAYFGPGQGLSFKSGGTALSTSAAGLLDCAGSGAQRKCQRFHIHVRNGSKSCKNYNLVFTPAPNAAAVTIDPLIGNSFANSLRPLPAATAGSTASRVGPGRRCA